MVAWFAAVAGPVSAILGRHDWEAKPAKQTCVEFVVVEWKGVAGVGGGEPLAAEEAGSIVEQVVGVRR